MYFLKYLMWVIGISDLSISKNHFEILFRIIEIADNVHNYFLEVIEEWE